MCYASRQGTPENLHTNTYRKLKRLSLTFLVLITLWRRQTTQRKELLLIGLSVRSIAASVSRHYHLACWLISGLACAVPAFKNISTASTCVLDVLCLCVVYVVLNPD